MATLPSHTGPTPLQVNIIKRVRIFGIWFTYSNRPLKVKA